MPERAQELAKLFPAHVVVETGVPGELPGDLLAEEAACVERAVKKRRDEFAAGRLLARRALERLDQPTTPLLPAEDRSPIWPSGIVGTISHTRGLCAVALARSSASRCLGLDIEDGSPLKDELVERIATPRELEWIRSSATSAAERGRLGKLIFSAKEAFYKCQYPLTKRFLEFEDVELSLDLEARTFTAKVRPDKAKLPSELRLDARFLLLDDFVVCAVSG